IVPGPDGLQRSYLTNLPAALWSPAAVRELYRLRWQVELVFKELKQDLSLEAVPTKDRHAAQVFLWASLLALVVSRNLVDSLASAEHAKPIGPVMPSVFTRALRGHLQLVRFALNAPLRTLAKAWDFIAASLREEIQRRPKSPRRDSLARLIPRLPALA